jgi:lysophospholipase L1-like esterase
MRTTILFLAGLVAGLVATPAAAQPAPQPRADCPPAAVEAVPLPATRAALREGGPFTVVAFGSSSTEGAGASAPGFSYPARLEVLLRAALPGRAVRVLNRGIGGQDVVEMLARLDADVLAERPQLVVWQAGANAALRGMDPGAFRDRLADGLARLRAAGTDVVLMDNQLAPVVVSRPLHPQIAAALRGEAAARSVPVFSRTALMRSWEAAGTPPADMLHADGLHHNDRGYACVAEALAESILLGLGAANPLVAGRR